MNWNELKKIYLKDHFSKNWLKQPQRRESALISLDELLKQHFSEVINDPQNLLKYKKEDFKAKVAKYKPNGRLSGAEKSVINGLYKFLN